MKLKSVMKLRTKNRDKTRDVSNIIAQRILLKRIRISQGVIKMLRFNSTSNTTIILSLKSVESESGTAQRAHDPDVKSKEPKRFAGLFFRSEMRITRHYEPFVIVTA